MTTISCFSYERFDVERDAAHSNMSISLLDQMQDKWLSM